MTALPANARLCHRCGEHYIGRTCPKCPPALASAPPAAPNSYDNQTDRAGEAAQKAHDIIAQKANDSLSLIEIEKLQAELAPLSLTERMKRFSIKEERADVLVPALDIYIYILKELNIRTLQVPNIGLSDGMIYAMHKEDLEK